MAVAREPVFSFLDLAAVAVELLVAVAVVLVARGAASSYGWAVVVVV